MDTQQLFSAHCGPIPSSILHVQLDSRDDGEPVVKSN